jgi:DNA (cytosine-5)-methyltransferase 1
MSEYLPYFMNVVRCASALRRFLAVSTFSGAGGSSVGYMLAGGRVVLATDAVSAAVRCYQANFPETAVVQRDFREIRASREAVEQFLARAGLRPGGFDLLDASPPCTEFSTAGNGVSDQNRVHRHSGQFAQRGTAELLFHSVEFASAALPKVVVTENVVGLATRHPDLLENALEDLRFGKSRGRRLYYAGWRILSASDFGVPQRRRRLFVLAIRRDVAEAVAITDDKTISTILPEPTHAPVSFQSAVADLRQTDEEVAPWLRAGMTGSLGRAIRHIPLDPPRWAFLPRAAGRLGTGFALVRASRKLSSPTLTASGQRPTSSAGVIHPTEHRKLTVPELKRVTGLPDDFCFPVDIADAAERIGNMVPPLMMKAIAEAVYERVLRPYSEASQ